jgi:hypothetical protein
MPKISKAAVFMQWICNRNETPRGKGSHLPFSTGYRLNFS